MIVPARSPLRAAAAGGAVIATLAGCAVAAAAAGAATIQTAIPCARYAGGGLATVPVAGSGFTPGATVRVGYGSDLGAFLTAGPDGSLAGAILPPTSFISSRANEAVFPLSAEDQSNTAITASGTARIARITVDVPQNTRNTRKKVKYQVVGFPNGRVVYAHYVFGGKRRKSVKIGRTKGDCGRITKRLRFLPVNRPRNGTWRIYFSNRKRYSKASALYLVKVTVFSVFR